MPLTRPTRTPIRIMARTPRMMFCVFIRIIQPTMPDRPSVEPTERSMPEVIMTSVIPMAISAVEET